MGDLAAVSSLLSSLELRTQKPGANSDSGRRLWSSSTDTSMAVKEKGRSSLHIKAIGESPKYLGAPRLQSLTPAVSMGFRQRAGRTHEPELKGLQELGPLPVVVG